MIADAVPKTIVIVPKGNVTMPKSNDAVPKTIVTVPKAIVTVPKMLGACVRGLRCGGEGILFNLIKIPDYVQSKNYLYCKKLFSMNDIDKVIENLYVKQFGHPKFNDYVTSLIGQNPVHFRSAFVIFLLAHVSLMHSDSAVRQKAADLLNDKTITQDKFDFLSENLPIK